MRIIEKILLFIVALIIAVITYFIAVNTYENYKRQQFLKKVMVAGYYEDEPGFGPFPVANEIRLFQDSTYYVDLDGSLQEWGKYSVQGEKLFLHSCYKDVLKTHTFTFGKDKKWVSPDTGF